MYVYTESTNKSLQSRDNTIMPQYYNYNNQLFHDSNLTNCTMSIKTEIEPIRCNMGLNIHGIAPIILDLGK